MPSAALLLLPLCVAATSLGGPHIRTLRSIAVVSEQLVKLKTCSAQGFVPRPVVTMLRSDMESLFGDLEAMIAPPPLQSSPAASASDPLNVQQQQQQTRRALQQSISLLEEQTEELDMSLQRLQEQQSESRAREVFDLIDINSDGVLQLEELQRAARCLIDDRCVIDPEGPFEVWVDSDDPQTTMTTERQIEALFNTADADQSGGLCFDEFIRMMGSLWGDSQARLCEQQQDALSRLCTALLESSRLELMARIEKGSARACDDLVEQWCALEQRIVMAKEKPLLPELEVLTAEAKTLAAKLPLDGASRGLGYRSRASRTLRQAISSGRASFRFCWRGLSITFRDVAQSIWMLRRPVLLRTPLGAEDWALARNTIKDLICLIPYSIIMVIPMSPPGHVFAFSLLNRCFPGAVPSGFTSSRQDLDEMFDLATVDTQKTPAFAAQAAAAIAVFLAAAAVIAAH